GIRDFHVTGVQTCALPIFAPRVPARGGDARDLLEELDRRDAAAHDRDAASGEVLGAHVVAGVELAADERVVPRVPRQHGVGPGAGRVDHEPRGPAAAVGGDDQLAVRVVVGAAYGHDVHGP